MAVALIQGASRGLGLQFCKALASRNQVCFFFSENIISNFFHVLLVLLSQTKKIIATSRDAEHAGPLLELQEKYPNKLELVNVDVTNEENIRASVAKVTEKSGGRIDLLINCSAILHPSGRGETSLRDVSFEVRAREFLQTCCL